MCPILRQRTLYYSSCRPVLRNQRHHQRIGSLLMVLRNQGLKRVYFFPTRVGSYGGLKALRRVTRVQRKVVEQWLSEQVTLHKPAITRFKRRCVVVGGLNQQWQADLADLSNLKEKKQRRYDVSTHADRRLLEIAWCV